MSDSDNSHNNHTHDTTTIEDSSLDSLHLLPTTTPDKPLWYPQKLCRSWKVTTNNEFWGCYLLTSLQPKSNNCTYVGSTNDPLRRLRQHNGELGMGAYQTLRKRPWEFALIVYGFPTHLAALQFEWAWQKPHQSRHLKIDCPGVYTKKTSEQMLPTKLKVVTQLLYSSGFAKWPLRLHFINPKVYQRFLNSTLPTVNIQLPSHMVISSGELGMIFPPPPTTSIQDEDEYFCQICGDTILDKILICSYDECRASYHIQCLATYLIDDPTTFLPVMGPCPVCKDSIVWGDLVRNLITKPLT